MIKDDFKDNAKHSGGDKDMPSAREPVSKEQKEELEKKLNKPRQEQHYTPGGIQEQRVHEQEDALKRGKINHIERRLRDARERKALKRNFNRSRD